MKSDSKVSRRQFFCSTCKVMIALNAARLMTREALAVPAPEGCNDAYCGIYCGACPALMNSLKAKKQSDIACLGCKSTKKAPGYANKCPVRKCAISKSLASCGLCKEFPCKKFDKFFEGAPKYGLREKYLYDIHDKGLAKWLEDEKVRWTCEKCKTPFAYGMTSCPKCGEAIYSDAEEYEDYKKNKKQKPG